jgi:predicted PurR-regulated permease PerM
MLKERRIGMIKTAVIAMLITTCCLSMAALASAVEVAPRITDREIIEGLSVLKQGNQDINKRIDDVNNRIDDLIQSVNKRFDDVNNRIDDLTQSVNKRFDDVNRRIDDLKHTMDQRFDDVNQRFTGIDQRFLSLEQRIDGMQSGLQNLIVALFGSVMALIIMLIGYIAWDRKTALQPLRARFESLEKLVAQQLDPDDTRHSYVARLIAAQRRAARSNPDLAEALRAEALL